MMIDPNDPVLRRGRRRWTRVNRAGGQRRVPPSPGGVQGPVNPSLPEMIMASAPMTAVPEMPQPTNAASLVNAGNRVTNYLPKGATLSPKGDLGKWRQMEARAVGRQFKGVGPMVLASKRFPTKGMQLPK